MKRLAFGMTMLALLVGCSTMQIQTDFSRDTDFSTFETFLYKESDESLAGVSPLAHERIVAAIRQELTNSGLSEVETDPDLLVAYYGSTAEQLQFQTSYAGAGGWGRWGRMGGMGMGTSTTRATTYEQGTLVIDVWEARENRLVWRGVVTDTLSSNPDRNTKMIQQGVSRVFENYPPS